MKKLHTHSAEFKQFVKKHELLYSPRTEHAKAKEAEALAALELIKHFDPFTINFLKKQFEEAGNRVPKF